MRSRGYALVLFLANDGASLGRNAVYWPPSRQRPSDGWTTSRALAVYDAGRGGIVAAESTLPHWHRGWGQEARVPVTQVAPGVFTTGHASCGYRTTTQPYAGGVLVSQT